MKTIYLSGDFELLESEDEKTKISEAKNSLGVLFPTDNLDFIHPTDLPYTANMGQRELMLRDLYYLSFCDAIYMLSDWKNSGWAKMEHAFARELGIEIIYQGEEYYADEEEDEEE